MLENGHTHTHTHTFSKLCYFGEAQLLTEHAELGKEPQKDEFWFTFSLFQFPLFFISLSPSGVFWGVWGLLAEGLSAEILTETTRSTAQSKRVVTGRCESLLRKTDLLR